VARNLKVQATVSYHDHLTKEGGNPMAEQRKGEQDKMRPERREEERTRREGEREQGGQTQNPRNPQRQQGS
jgi:hypothetical protein